MEDFNDTDFILSSQALREIEAQERAERNRKIEEEEEIFSEEIINESPISTSSLHRQTSVVERIRLATQEHCEKNKINKTKRRHKRNSESLSLSRLIHKEIEDVDFNAWYENILTKLYFN